ncbi:MAG: hypothetical protein Q9216_003223 [Gyalolechia sp. 2 TL-2023]
MPLEYRCGRPFEKSFDESRYKFFLSDIYGATDLRSPSLMVYSDIFRAFFGFKLAHWRIVPQDGITETEAESTQSHSEEMQGPLPAEHQPFYETAGDSMTRGSTALITQSATDNVDHLLDDDLIETDGPAMSSQETANQNQSGTALEKWVDPSGPAMSYYENPNKNHIVIEAANLVDPAEAWSRHGEGGWMLVDAELCNAWPYPRD